MRRDIAPERARGRALSARAAAHGRRRADGGNAVLPAGGLLFALDGTGMGPFACKLDPAHAAVRIPPRPGRVSVARLDFGAPHEAPIHPNPTLAAAVSTPAPPPPHTVAVHLHF